MCEGIQTDKYVKLRQMLSTAALSTALISWMTTAKGLHHFVFDSLWQAYIISGALQGALFTLSIMGIEILFSLDQIIKRVCFILVWACLLVSSSIFSYVFISKVVYSNRLLQEDAHRILGTYCLIKNYELSAAADNLLDDSETSSGVISNMNEYINQLAVLENGIDLSEGGNDKKVENIRTSLLPYAYTYNTSDSNYNNEVEGCIDTSDLVLCLDIILTGHYTDQDLTDTKSEAIRLNTAIEQKIAEVNNYKADKTSLRTEIQERLKSYSNLKSPQYKDLVKQLNDAIEEIQKSERLVENLGKENEYIQKVPNILDSIEGSMVSSLYNEVFQIRSLMNAENIDVKKVQNIAEEIYNTLIENSVKIAANDPRLTGYSGFKSNLSKYDTIIMAQKSINNEIEELYHLQNITELTINNNNKSEEEIPSDSANWINYWEEHLNSLKENAKRLRSGGLDETLIDELIESSENRERLYLSDLNDFERAWSLLFSRNPEHPYKILLVFSCIFAFGIDLFSVAMSCLLYLFRNKSF